MIAFILIFFILTILSLCKVSSGIDREMEDMSIKENIKKEIY